jgi:isopenicillin-N epimerase
MTRADSTATDWADSWAPMGQVIYLNHGSFGRAPRVVLEAQASWTALLQRDPIDFFTRRLDGLLDHAADVMAKFVGCKSGDLTFVPNATVAMNIVAANIQLDPGDEVLLNDHEYGAVHRIWRGRCQQSGATLVTARLPQPLESKDQIVDAIFSSVTERTRLIVISHVTSPTAIVFPAEEICTRARAAGIRTCVDGPHALAMRPLNLEMLGCDYYCVSCHKWLAAAIGSGWLYVRGGLKNQLHPTTVSWGRSLSGRPFTWKDEFHWPGTFDPAAYLSTTAAIEFLGRVGLDHFRSSSHALAAEARQRLISEADAEPLSPDGPDWYGSMVTLRLPWLALRDAGVPINHPFQTALWEQFQIEVPVMQLNGRAHLRVSCHLYTKREQIDALLSAVRQLRPAHSA